MYTRVQQEESSALLVPYHQLWENMTGLVDEQLVRKKRKHTDAPPGRNAIGKKRKKHSKERTETDIHSEILLLESQIVQSRLHYNDIGKLLRYASSSDNQDGRDVAGAVALCRVFCKLMVQGSMSPSPRAPENEATVVKWILQKYQEYQGNLAGLLRADAHRQSTALTLIMKLVKVEAAELKLPEQSVWLSGVFSKFISVVAEDLEAEQARAEFGDKYLEQYHDVRYYTLLNLS